MREGDFDEFAEMLDGVCSLLSRGAYVPNEANTALWFRSLVGHDLASVRAAFDAHVKDPQRGRFVPVPADILAQVETGAAADGRPEPDEAWAIAVRAADEVVTIVWTSEIAEAWGIALPVLRGGDEVGARMAFKAAYGRMVLGARALRLPIRWAVTLGHDAALRDEALVRAVSDGRLPQQYLPAPQGPVAGLLELATVRGVPPGMRERLMAIREQLVARNDGPSPDAAAKAETAAAKRRVDEAVRRYAEGKAADGDGAEQ